MIDRVSLISRRMMASDALRNEDVRRRSTGAQYYLLMPVLAIPLFYYALASGVSMLLSSASSKLRLKVRGFGHKG